MSRFDPRPDVHYAVCTDCDETFPTKEEMSAHLMATMTNGRSHSASIKNPSRLERIKRELQQVADDKVSEFTDEAWELVDREGVTEEEISEAVRSVFADFADAWEDSRRENGE